MICNTGDSYQPLFQDMAWCPCISLLMRIGWNSGKLEETGPDVKRFVSKKFSSVEYF